MKKAAIYIRVSTAEQKTDMQRQDLQAYAEQRGYEIYAVYEDVISGTMKKRPALNRLMTDARKRKFDIVLVWKFDRFARSLSMLIKSLEEFKELGIDFISREDEIDTTTSIGRLMFHINAAYAEYERDIIAARVKAGINARRAKIKQWGRQEIDLSVQRKIKALRASKVSIRATAKQLGISANTVRKYG